MIFNNFNLSKTYKKTLIANRKKQKENELIMDNFKNKWFWIQVNETS